MPSRQNRNQGARTRGMTTEGARLLTVAALIWRALAGKYSGPGAGHPAWTRLRVEMRRAILVGRCGRRRYFRRGNDCIKEKRLCEVVVCGLGRCWGWWRPAVWFLRAPERRAHRWPLIKQPQPRTSASCSIASRGRLGVWSSSATRRTRRDRCWTTAGNSNRTSKGGRRFRARGLVSVRRMGEVFTRSGAWRSWDRRRVGLESATCLR